jgi:hypothetical protein
MNLENIHFLRDSLSVVYKDTSSGSNEKSDHF